MRRLLALDGEHALLEDACDAARAVLRRVRQLQAGQAEPDDALVEPRMK